MLDATFDVQFTDEAEKHYNALDANMTRRVNRAIELLAQNPLFGPNIVKLKGQYAGQYRYRVGSYRIVYSVDMQSQACIIRGIYSRGRAYRP
jgi:mRNA interferase RelE/StbE